MEPAMRVPAVLLKHLAEEIAAGRATLPLQDADLSPALRKGMRAVVKAEDSKFAGFGPAATAAALSTWCGLLGAVAGEVFFHVPFEATGKAGDALFRFTMARQLTLLGFSEIH